MARRSTQAREAAQAAVVADKDEVIRLYREGVSMNQLADDREVSARWLAAPFDSWDEPRRDPAAARAVLHAWRPAAPE